MEEIKVGESSSSPVNKSLSRSPSGTVDIGSSTLVLKRGLSRLDTGQVDVQGKKQDALSLTAEESAIMVDGDGNFRDELGFPISGTLTVSPHGSRKSSARQSESDAEDQREASIADVHQADSSNSSSKVRASNSSMTTFPQRHSRSTGEAQRRAWEEYQHQIGGTVMVLTTAEVQRWRKNLPQTANSFGNGDAASEKSVQSTASKSENDSRLRNEGSDASTKDKRRSFLSSLFHKTTSKKESNNELEESRAGSSSSNSPFHRIGRGSSFKFLNPTRTRGKLLTQLIRTHGIPTELRAQVWKACSGASDKERLASLEEQYECILEKVLESPPEAAAQIELDLHRTFPTNYLYQKDEGIASLRHVLLAYSMRNPDVGYCQSMNFIVATLLLHMDEKDAFWVLSAIVEDLLPGYFTKELVGVHVDQRTFVALVAARFPRVTQHLNILQLPLAPVAYQWFMCLFVNALPLGATLRVWDAFLHEGPKVLFRVALTIIKVLQRDILAANNFQDAYEVLSEGTKNRDLFSGSRVMRLAFDSLSFGSFSAKMLAEIRERQLISVRRELNLDENNKPISSPVVERQLVLDTLVEETSDLLAQEELQASDQVDAAPTKQRLDSPASDHKLVLKRGSTASLKRDKIRAELTADSFRWEFSPRPVRVPYEKAASSPFGFESARPRASTLQTPEQTSDESQQQKDSFSSNRSRALSFESPLRATLPSGVSDAKSASKDEEANSPIATKQTVHNDVDDVVEGRGSSRAAEEDAMEVVDSDRPIEQEAREASDDATIWDSDEEEVGEDDHMDRGAAAGNNATLQNENLSAIEAGGASASGNEDSARANIPTVDLPAEFSTRLRTLSYVMNARQTNAAVVVASASQYQLSQVPEEELLDLHEIFERFDEGRRSQAADENPEQQEDPGMHYGPIFSSTFSNEGVPLTATLEENDPPVPITPMLKRNKKPKSRTARLLGKVFAPFTVLAQCSS